MKHLLVALIILSFLAFPIPIDKLKNMSNQELNDALALMLGFFTIISKCEHAQYVDYLQEGNNMIFVIECKDKEA